MNHSCCGSSQVPPLPTRIINVGTRNKDPYLNISDGQAGTYIALSYCWGDPQQHIPLVTTDDNFQDHRLRLPYIDLPKTIKDAIILCRELEVNYLWVDALCIIQGNADDWTREAAQMCNVYSNAILTISVDNAEGSSRGIFTDQEYGQAKLLHLDGRPIYVRKALAREHNHMSTLVIPEDRTDMRPNPILSRGWCLQEAVLSNRILRYTSQEMVWECNEVRRCECESLYDGSDELSLRLLRRPGDLGSVSLEIAYRLWKDILQHFSERYLSVEADKLPALSGLAEKFQIMLRLTRGRSENYIAGMWAGDLATSLLWYIQDDYWKLDGFPGPQHRRPSTWRAPSWSMMAIEGPIVLFPLDQWINDMEIINISIQLSDPVVAPYGAMRAGSLTLRGRVVHGLKSVAVQAYDGAPAKGFINSTQYQLEDPNGDTYVFSCDNPPSLILGTQDLSGLYMGHSLEKQRSEAYWHAFLVLRKSESIPDAFERVGISYPGTMNPHAKDLFKDGPMELVKLI